MTADDRADDRAAYIDGLRQLAAALEAHPGLPLPWEGRRGSGHYAMHLYFGGDGAAGKMAAAARALPCAWRKEIAERGGGGTLRLNGQLAGLDVRLLGPLKDVAEPKVTGNGNRTEWVFDVPGQDGEPA